MESMKSKASVVFKADYRWWESINKLCEIEIDDAPEIDASAKEAASVAGIDLDDGDAWISTVVDIADRHSAIRPGDYCCCHGFEGDVVFVRMSP